MLQSVPSTSSGTLLLDDFSLGKYHQKKAMKAVALITLIIREDLNPYLIKVIVWVPTHFSFTHN
jgi:hypothetical protein